MTKPARRLAQKIFSRPLADFVGRTLDPLVARQGFGESSLLLQWEAIVGARIAGLCQPVRLRWPHRGKSRAPEKQDEPATLTLRVEPGFGLDIQHMSGAIINRVNAHLGWRCVAKLAFVQEALQRDPPRLRPPKLRDPVARARAEETARGVEDEALRNALSNLGEHVYARDPNAPAR